MLTKLIRGAFLLTLGFVGLRLASPYVKDYQFRRLIYEEVDSHASRAHPEELRDHVLQIGRGMELNLAPDDISVEHSPRSVEVRVTYSMPVDLIWYQYRIHFEIVAHPTYLGG